LGSVEIRQRLRSELLMWSFGKTFFMKYLVSLYWTDKSVTYFWGDVFFYVFEICVRLSWSARLVWLSVLDVQRAGSLNDKLQML
jgi:hypothetical protein